MPPQIRRGRAQEASGSPEETGGAAEDEAEKAGVLKKPFNIAPWLALEFREKAEPAAPPAAEIGRRKKKAKRARREGKGAGPRAEETTPRETEGRDHVVGGQQRREPMPRYEFMCEKCKKRFELIMTISEREKGEVKCPKCKSTKVVPQLGGFMAQTSKKS